MILIDNLKLKIDEDIIFKYKEKQTELVDFHYIVMFRKFDNKVMITSDLTPRDNYNGLNAIEITNKTLIGLLQSADEARLQLFLNLYKNYTNK